MHFQPNQVSHSPKNVFNTIKITLEQSIFSEYYSDELLSNVTSLVGYVEDPTSKHHNLRGMWQFGTPKTDEALQKFKTEGKDIHLATNDELQGLFLNMESVQIDQHGYVYGKFSHNSVEDHLFTC